MFDMSFLRQIVEFLFKISNVRVLFSEFLASEIDHLFSPALYSFYRFDIFIVKERRFVILSSFSPCVTVRISHTYKRNKFCKIMGCPIKKMGLLLIFSVVPIRRTIKTMDAMYFFTSDSEQ